MSTNRHLVGRITDFGKLMAESVKWDIITQTVAVYEIDGEKPYMVILWDIGDEYQEVEISREYHETDEDALASYLMQAFNISL